MLVAYSTGQVATTVAVVDLPTGRMLQELRLSLPVLDLEITTVNNQVYLSIRDSPISSKQFLYNISFGRAVNKGFQ